MLGEMYLWRRSTKTSVWGNGPVAQLIHKVGPPIPLQTRRVQRVEHALQSWLRQRANKIERVFFERTDGFERFFRFLLRTDVCPDHPAHFFQVQMFGKRSDGRHCEKGKKTIQIIRRGRD